MTKNNLMTAGAVALALLAVAYAFRKPAAASAVTRQSLVTDWGRVWDDQMAGLQLSANVGQYNNLLTSRGFGFTL